MGYLYNFQTIAQCKKNRPNTQAEANTYIMHTTNSCVQPQKKLETLEWPCHDGAVEENYCLTVAQRDNCGFSGGIAIEKMSLAYNPAFSLFADFRIGVSAG
jgi:hypothetical protein